MGAVVSCIKGVFRAIGNCLMAIVNGIGAILRAIVDAVVSVFDIIISCLTCQRSGSRRTRTTQTVSSKRRGFGRNRRTI